MEATRKENHRESKVPDGLPNNPTQIIVGSYITKGKTPLRCHSWTSTRIWQPGLAQTITPLGHKAKLHQPMQIIQSVALHDMSGAYKSTPSPVLHHETQMSPLPRQTRCYSRLEGQIHTSKTDDH